MRALRTKAGRDAARARAVTELRFRRHIVALSGKRRPRRKAPRQTLPIAAETAQRSRLTAMVERMRALVNEIVVPTLDRYAHHDGVQNVGTHVQGAGVLYRHDADDGEEIKRTVDRVRRAMDQEYPDTKVAGMARQFGSQIDAHNAAEQAKQFEATIGVKPVDIDSEDILSSFVRDNVRLITSIPDDALDQIEGVILRGAQQGKTAVTMAREIQERVDVSKSRAQLIARDQTNKLYGALTKARQTATGAESYIWRTSRDERVRESHAALEGQIIKWDDPPAVGHPGFDINCRCTAEVNAEELLNRLEGDDTVDAESSDSEDQ